MNAMVLEAGHAAPPDGWSWWQARRLRYNLALGGAGWAAYLTAAALHAAFGSPLWASGRETVSVTLFFGLGFLVLMGVANICYLAGPLAEAIIQPADLPRFRSAAWAMGFWGSVALPFLFPLLNLSMLIGPGGG